MRLWPAHIWLTPSLLDWSELLVRSYRHWLGRELLEPAASPMSQSERLFFAPFVVVSHGLEEDPLLNYGNRLALELWEMPWEDFIRTPSRLTAETENQAERARMLAEAAARGFVEDYAGVRLSRSGRRFFIEQACVWTVIDGAGRRQGQAASFSRWRLLPGASQSCHERHGQ